MSAGYDGCWQIDENKQGNRKIFVSMTGADLFVPKADSYQEQKVLNFYEWEKWEGLRINNVEI